MRGRAETEIYKRNAYLYIRAAAPDASYNDLYRLEEELVKYCYYHGCCHVGTVMSRGGRNYGIEFLRRDIEAGRFKVVDIIYAIAYGSETNSIAFYEVYKLLREYNIHIPIVIIKGGART